MLWPEAYGNPVDAVPADLSEWWGVRGEAFLNGCGLGGAEFLRAGTQFPHAEFFQVFNEGLGAQLVW